MIKVFSVPLLIIAACIIAGLYGMAHNQISYAVSDEFFKQFLFRIMGFSPSMQTAWGASVVGLISTWWMGLIIGLVLTPLGLMIPGWKAYIQNVLLAFLLVAITALLVGIIALGFSFITIRAGTVGEITGVSNPVAYRRAGMMHNFSYLGGFLGMVCGIIFIVMRNLQVRKQLKVKENEGQVFPTKPPVVNQIS